MSAAFRRLPSWWARIALCAVALASCDSPATDIPRDELATMVRAAILDGAHDPRYPRVYFLPPMVPQPKFNGTFDATVLPNLRVTICRWNGGACSGAPVAEFVDGTGKDALRLTGEQYHANWEVRDPVTLGAYRLAVMLGTTMIGGADLRVVNKPQDLNSVPATDIGVVQGRTLPIKFRVEVATIQPVASITVEPASASVIVGGTQQFTAVVRDAAGNILTDRPVTWGSSDDAVASVDAGGLATGRAPGGVTIRATAEAVTGSATLSVTIADLVMTGVTAPASVPTGGTFNVTAAVQNTGAADAAATDVRFRVLAPSGEELATLTRPQGSLVAGANTTVDATFTAAMSWPASVTVEATTDAGGSVAEASESNNTAQSNAVAITIADLVVSGIAVPASVPRGGSLNVSATIQNAGGADAAATSVRFRVLSVATGDEMATMTLPQSAVAAGASIMIAHTFTAAQNWPESVLVEVITDVAGSVAERNESNNTAQSSHIVITIADLGISTLTLSTNTVVLRCALGVQVVVRNSGNGTAVTTSLRISLRDAGGIVFATTTLAQPEILPGASAPVNAAFTAASTWPVEFTVLAETDVGGTVPEADETNNSATNTGGTVQARVTAPTGFNKMWVCGGNTSWTDANNWEPAGVPLATHHVYIPAGVAHYPLLTANTTVANLTIEEAAHVDVGSAMLISTGNVHGGEVRGAGILRMTGATRTLRGRAPNLEVFSSLGLSGNARAASLLINGGTAIGTPSLDPKGFTISVDGNFTIPSSTTVNPHLHMLSATDRIEVGGAMSLGSRSNLQKGTIVLRGNFSQHGDAFTLRPVGTLFVFDGSAAQNVSFVHPATSWFDDVEIRTLTARGGVTFTTDVRVTGRLIVVANARVNQSAGSTFYTTALPEEESAAGYQVGTSRIDGAIAMVKNITLASPDANFMVSPGTPAGTPSLTIGSFTFELAGDFTIPPSTSVNPHLLMAHAAGRLDVGGDMTVGSRSNLAAGAIVVRGNFRQHGDAFSLRPTGTDFIFEGSAAQTAQFVHPANSFFADVEIGTPASAGGVTFGVPGTTDVRVAGQLVVKAGAQLNQTPGGSVLYNTRLPEEVDAQSYRVMTSRIAGAVAMVKSITLAWPDADFIVNGGDALGTPSLSLGGFRFTLGGDFSISASSSVNPHLIMSVGEPVLDVGGNMSVGSRSTLADGTIIVRGNFHQHGDAFTLRPAGTKFVFEGTAAQTVSFVHPANSFFDGVEIRTPAGVGGVTFGVPGATDVSVNGQLTVIAGALLQQTPGGSVIYETRLPEELAPQGYQATTSRIDGPVAMVKAITWSWPGANLIINGGNAFGTPSLTMGGFAFTLAGGFTINASTSVNNHLFMTAGNPTLDIGGSMTVGSRSNLAVGTIIVRGSFLQHGDAFAFRPTGTRVVFNGTAAQSIMMTHPGNSFFGHVEVAAPASASLASDVRMSSLQLNGALLVPSPRVLTVTGTLFLAGSLANNGTVNVGSCTNQGGTVSGTGNNPC